LPAQFDGRMPVHSCPPVSMTAGRAHNQKPGREHQKRVKNPYAPVTQGRGRCISRPRTLQPRSARHAARNWAKGLRHQLRQGKERRREAAVLAWRILPEATQPSRPRPPPYPVHRVSSRRRPTPGHDTFSGLSASCESAISYLRSPLGRPTSGLTGLQPRQGNRKSISGTRHSSP
jgi:hypothetical protein